MAAVLFPEVRDILDKIIKDWEAGNGSPARLIPKHGPSFGWATRDALLAAQAKGKPLIQPEIIGKVGHGAEANLVIDLIKGLGTFPQMPLGGLDSNKGVFLTLSSPEVVKIIAWVEEGCLP